MYELYAQLPHHDGPILWLTGTLDEVLNDFFDLRDRNNARLLEIRWVRQDG